MLERARKRAVQISFIEVEKAAADTGRFGTKRIGLPSDFTYSTKLHQLW
jgi:hypothetical protein